MIIIVVGLPGTGKTTFSRALAERLNALHLNTDIIRDQLDLRGIYDRQTKNKIYIAMQNRASEAVIANQHVVIDGTFYQERLRNSYDKFAKKHNIPIHWIELKAKESVIKERVKKKRKYSEANFEVYLKVKALFEPMRRECLEIWTDKGNKLNQLVKQALQYLNFAPRGENYL